MGKFSALRTGPRYPPPPPRKYSWHSFLLEAESTPGSYVNEPATFWLVAQCHNQLPHRVPHPIGVGSYFYKVKRPECEAGHQIASAAEVTEAASDVMRKLGNFTVHFVARLS
jgi:hypothetical protein